MAAVQVASANGQIEANLAHALERVEEVAARGAELVVLPEFLPTGYLFSPAIWDAAEPAEGPTVQWLTGHARRLAIYLGTSFLEADGDDFFNTFVLATPDGEVAGRVRKQTPAAFEAFYTTGMPGPHVIDTALGRIGVSICYESLLAYTPHCVRDHGADLLIMPHSAPAIAPKLLSAPRLLARYDELLAGLAPFHAERLGVPAIMVNKCGPWESPLPGLSPFVRSSHFPGLSAIADSDGSLQAQLGAEEGVLVEEVTLDPARKASALARSRGRWCLQVPWQANLLRVIETVGKAWYGASRERRLRARAVSGDA